MEIGKLSDEDLISTFGNKLRNLVMRHDPNRRERFLPFLIVLLNKTQDPRYEQSLSIAKYFLENAMLSTPEDELFFRAINAAMTARTQETASIPDTQSPMQDYLKVLYDLRE